MRIPHPPSAQKFQSTRPLRGGTADPLLGTNGNAISIHPPLAGRDTYLRSIRRACCHFNPPAPCGAGLRLVTTRASSRSFQSTRPLWGGTSIASLIVATTFISIHPPLAGRDQLSRSAPPNSFISIHPPLAGRDSDLAQKNCAKHRILHKKCIYPGRIERFSGFDAAIFLPNVHKFRCEPSEESLLAPRSHAYTIRTPSG